MSICLMRLPVTSTRCSASAGLEAAAFGAAAFCAKAGAAAAAHATAINERRYTRARVEISAFMGVLGKRLGIVLGTLTKLSHMQTSCSPSPGIPVAYLLVR